MGPVFPAGPLRFRRFGDFDMAYQSSDAPRALQTGERPQAANARAGSGVTSELLQEPVNLIKLHLQLREPCQLQIQLFSDLGKLILNKCQHLCSLHLRTGRTGRSTGTSQPACASLSGFPYRPAFTLSAGLSGFPGRAALALSAGLSAPARGSALFLSAARSAILAPHARQSTVELRKNQVCGLKAGTLQRCAKAHAVRPHVSVANSIFKAEG
jgi:hypothetical protein